MRRDGMHGNGRMSFLLSSSPFPLMIEAARWGSGSWSSRSPRYRTFIAHVWRRASFSLFSSSAVYSPGFDDTGMVSWVGRSTSEGAIGAGIERTGLGFPG